MKRRALIRILVILAGLGFVAVSLFAFQLGLDNDPGWGKSRSIILAIGLVTALFGTSFWFMQYLYKLPLVRGLSLLFEPEDEDNEKTSERKIGIISDIILAILFILAVCYYGWVITFGKFDRFPPGRDYYGLLAQAFQQGQVHLPVEPNPALLQLENPYDYQQRKDIPHLWDTTLYNGKYYLYWGPVPAVLGLLFLKITSKPVTDAGLVFGLVVTTALFSILLLRALNKKFDFSSWLFWGAVLGSLVNIPIIWPLTHPLFYEVSAVGGLAFVIAGFYFLFLSFTSTSPKRVFLLLAVLSFCLAGGSRINLIPSVVILAIFMMWWVYKFHHKKILTALPDLLVIVLPLTFIAAMLAWYNFARFGSILEFGHRYQLTGANVTPIFNQTLSFSYISPNLYSYVFRLPDFSTEFPFVTLPWVQEKMWPSFLYLPDGYYYTDPVGGLLFVIPSIGLAVLMGLRVLWRFINGETIKKPAAPFFIELMSALLAYCLLQSFVIFFYIASNMRYLLDISQQFILLTVLFVFFFMPVFAINRFQKRVVAFLWIIASLATVLMGLLIGLTGPRNNFLNQNSQLFFQLMDWFAR